MSRLKEALFYEKLDNNRVRCNICPHRCIIANNSAGYCKVRENHHGILYTISYGEITSSAYDPIEKKPLYHFYPGSKIFSIGSFGCNLSCAYCQNWEIAQARPMSINVYDEDIIRLAAANDSIGIAYTYNEPSIWYEYVLNLSKKIRNANLKNVLVTNGYIEREPLEGLLPYIDAVNIDLKFMEDELYRKICGGSISPVLDNIKLACEHTHVEVTALIIEGVNSSEDSIENMAKALSSIDKDIPLHLNRYYPAYKLSLPETNLDVLLKGKEIASKYLNFVYIGNVWGIDTNTYCPKCRNKIVDRNYNADITGLQDNKCNKCGYNIKLIH